MRQVFALDLKDDPLLIEAYERAHVRIWPEVRDHLRQHGVVEMEIYRLGTRMIMIMDTDDARFDPVAMLRSAEENSAVQAWEALMGCLQLRLSEAPDGVKWAAMQKIFSLSAQGNTKEFESKS